MITTLAGSSQAPPAVAAPAAAVPDAGLPDAGVSPVAAELTGTATGATGVAATSFPGIATGVAGVIPGAVAAASMGLGAAFAFATFGTFAAVGSPGLGVLKPIFVVDAPKQNEQVWHLQNLWCVIVQSDPSVLDWHARWDAQALEED